MCSNDISELTFNTFVYASYIHSFIRKRVKQQSYLTNPLHVEPDSGSAGQEIPCLFMKPKVSLPCSQQPVTMDHTFNRINSVHSITPFL
jgi:hypothetical protein